MNFFRRLRSLPGLIVVTALDLLPQGKLESLITGLAAHRASAVPAAEALRMLFRLEAALYPLAGRYAIAYGNGVHTKHRHTGYHGFFIARCRSDQRILEVGCGSGALAFDIATQAGSLVTGVDLVPEKIAEARQRFPHPRLELHVGDATEGLPEGHYDTVVLSNVLEHVPDRATFLRRVAETTQAERLLIRVPLFERDWRVPLKRELGIEWRLDPSHETEYTLESFAQEMEEADLRVMYQEVRWGEIWAEAVPGAIERRQRHASDN